jgi:hypothetical protein
MLFNVKYADQEDIVSVEEADLIDIVGINRETGHVILTIPEHIADGAKREHRR